jgi:hypothetical protein
VEGEPQRRTRPSILAGQLLASGFTAFFITFFIADAISEGVDSWEEITLTVLLVFACLSVLVAWLQLALGSRLLLACAIAMAGFGAVASGSNQVLAAVLLSAPYLLSALAIWYGARRLARPAGP